MHWARSIRFRVTAIAVATSTAVVLAFGWLFLELVTDRLLAAGEEELLSATAEIEGFVLVDLGESGAQYQLEDADFSMLLELDEDGDVFVNLQPSDDPTGSSVGAFVLDGETGEIREIVEESPALSRQELEQLSVEGAEELRQLADELAGERLELVQSTQDAIVGISDGVDAARDAAFIVGPLLVVASGLIIWVVVGRALAPTRRIAAEAAAIGTDTLDRRITTQGGDDEVDTIARVLNEMLERIEAGVQREQQFVADASHELRTPLTSARMAAELAAADAPGSRYPPQLLEEIDRMRALVDDLLRLARDGDVRTDEIVPLDALVADVVAEHPAADLIQTSLAEGVTVWGRADELGRLLGNLLDNAARFAASSIEVGLRESGSEVVLTVDDDGPGIPEADRVRAFDRFVRLDEGRGRDEGGSGLGLAIVRAIATRHGGSVTIGSAPIGGARIEVRLARGR